MSKPNREYKDSVFVDLFSTYEDAEKNFRSLYSALCGRELSDDATVRNIRFENTVYTGLKNDVSYLVDGRLVVLVEHQSTINENMPRRCLEYLAETYKRLGSNRDRYHRKLQRLPRPEFYVLYNGLEEYPAESFLRLSDAYFDDCDKASYNNINTEAMAEIRVKVININKTKGGELLKKCSILDEYSVFVEDVRRYSGDDAQGFDRAIKECIRKGVLSEYLQRRATEVKNIMLAEYDYELDILTQREEAERIGREEGRAEGEARGIIEGEARGEARGKIEGKIEGITFTAKQMLHKNYSIDSIMEITGLTAEEIEKL